MLVFPLKKEWYEKIKSGEKTIEYREVKPYWTKRLEKLWNHYTNDHNLRKTWYEFTGWVQPKCKLRLGYTNKYMTANITKVEIFNGKDTDLHIDKPVYAIHLSNVRKLEGEE